MFSPAVAGSVTVTVDCTVAWLPASPLAFNTPVSAFKSKLAATFAVVENATLKYLSEIPVRSMSLYQEYRLHLH